MRTRLKETVYSFLLYSVVGWCIDTGFRSVVSGHFEANNALGIPFSPMYGAGAVAILHIYPYIQHWARWKQFGLYALLLPTYEYLGGVVSEWFLGRRLWDYSSYPLNIGAYTDPIHAVVWGTAALLVLYIMQPSLRRALSLPARHI